MATQAITVVVVRCDICKQPYERDDTVIHFDSETEGIDYVIGARWLRDSDGRLICTRSDRAHDTARIPGLHL